MAKDDLSLDLDARSGWPPDLLFLLERYPREVWEGHANFGTLTRFWLGRHAMFRELSGALVVATSELREGRVDAGAFQSWFAPRFRFFLAELDGHHQIEDVHYFPVMAAAEARLARGFDILEGDHDAIHQDLLKLQESGGALARALGRGQGGIDAPAEVMAGDLEGFLKRLDRHLADEEDLIVPLILDRSEHGLGVA